MSLEYMHSNSKQEDIFNFDEERLYVPTQVARRLLHRNNGSEGSEMLARVSQCLHIHIQITEGSDTHQTLVTVQTGDRQAVHEIRHMLASIGRDMANGVDTTMDYVRQEDKRRRVMEGDVGPCIITYLDDKDLPNVACTNRYYADEMHEARNTWEAFVYVSTRRLQQCVNMLRAQSGDLDGRDQVEIVEAGKYGDIEVAINNYSVGQCVRIMNDAGHTYVSNNLVRHNGTAVRCTRERNTNSHITVI